MEEHEEIRTEKVTEPDPAGKFPIFQRMVPELSEQDNPPEQDTKVRPGGRTSVMVEPIMDWPLL